MKAGGGDGGRGRGRGRGKGEGDFMDTYSTCLHTSSLVKLCLPYWFTTASADAFIHVYMSLHHRKVHSHTVLASITVYATALYSM